MGKNRVNNMAFSGEMSIRILGQHLESFLVLVLYAKIGRDHQGRGK